MKEIIAVAGPTASGKSALALAICEKYGGELVSVDSMQVYRGMDIGTAKPDESERARVPHHLIDICSPEEAFSAADFRRTFWKFCRPATLRLSVILWSATKTLPTT